MADTTYHTVVLGSSVHTNQAKYHDHESAPTRNRVDLQSGANKAKALGQITVNET